MDEAKTIPFSKKEWQDVKGAGGGCLNGRNKWHLERLQCILGTRKWTILFIAMGFFLGRAMILNQLFPFAVAFFTVIYFSRRDSAIWVGIALLVGSLFSAKSVTLMMAMQLLFIVFMHRGWKAYGRSHPDMNVAPFMVFTSSLIVNLFITFISTGITWYALAMDITDAALSLILTLVFVQALSILTINKRNYTLRIDEVICLMILLASMMTGTIGWIVQSLQLDHILSRYFVLLFAFVGGASFGASVGVVLGLILGLAEPSLLSQMSVLAFSGLLAGLLWEGKRWMVAFGMLLGTTILSVYLGPFEQVMMSIGETIAAATLFLLTPTSVCLTVAKYVPGTNEHSKSQHEYAKRMRDMTADRVQQFSKVFDQLSRSFKQTIGSNTDTAQWQKEDVTNAIIDATSIVTCSSCPRQQTCWSRKSAQTMMMMKQMLRKVEIDTDYIGWHDKQIPHFWKTHCLRIQQILTVLRDQYVHHVHEKHLRKQLQDSRQFVAQQLSGVSQVMEDLVKEIQREGRELFMQAEKIHQAVEDLGLSVHRVDIVSLDAGRVEIEMVHTFTEGYDECRKLIAPLLSDILGEYIVVREQSVTSTEGQGVVSFVTAKVFEVDVGMAGMAKGGGMLSGDSFHALELGSGKFAVALSDGMGNGERARQESSTALHLLSRLLQARIDEKLAIKSVNSVLALRSPDEVYATLDLAIIDLFSAKAMLFKSGSTPSFIRRGDDVHFVSSNNLPIGILQDIDIELVDTPLASGDIVIMMTDGVFDAPGPTINKEQWMKRIIQEVGTGDPQEMADILLEMVIRHCEGQIDDDMTIVVTRVMQHKPQWSTLYWNESNRIERPLIVS